MTKNLFFHENILSIFENVHLFERENDYNQIKNAEKLYNRIIKILETDDISIPYILLQPECDLKLYFISELWYKNDSVWFIPKINTIIFILNSERNKQLFEVKGYVQILKNMKESVIHELVHYLDYFRITIEEYNPGMHYNNSEEFNTYYLKISSDVYKTLEETFADSASNFIKMMWKVINERYTDLKEAIFNDNKYKYKWSKRLYQLYFEIRDKFITKKMTEQIKNDIKTKYFD